VSGEGRANHAQTPRPLAVRACLGLVWLFNHTPLRRLSIRQGHPRFDSYDNYIADRTGSMAEYHALFSDVCSFRGKVVAELGCSEGYLLHSFRRIEEFTPIGIDIDPRVLAMGRKTYGERIQFVQATATEIPLPTASVDVIYSVDTVEHLSDLRGILLDCHRVLRPGGVVLIHFTSWWGACGPHLEDVIPFPWPHLLFSMDTLLAAAAEIYDSTGHVAACYWFDRETGERRPNPYRDRKHWDEFLNRMTIRKFRRLLTTLPLEVIEFRKLGFGGKRFLLARYVSLLGRVPGLDEIFAKAIFCALKKPASAAR
jgi:SAM-dependent methyltransferase